MANASKCELDSILGDVLSTTGAERNMAYPPYIFSQHFNIATSFLISKLVSQYPSNNQVIDMLEPFVRVVKIPVTNGFINLQSFEEYRNILGAPYINMQNGSMDKPCDCDDLPITASQFKSAIAKAGCNLVPIVIVPQSEFAYLTSSLYKQPTMQKPIGYMADAFNIKVCPYNIPTVTVMYVIQEPTYIYGYTVQPDDTFIFNPNTSLQSDWTSAAYRPLFEAITALYSSYVSNPELTNFAQILKGL